MAPKEELHAADRLRSRGWEVSEKDERTVAQLFCDQVEFANVVVMNKMDLMDETERARLRALLRRVNPGATDDGYTAVRLIDPLPEGMRIVTQGAYYVYAQSQSGELEHGH